MVSSIGIVLVGKAVVAVGKAVVASVIKMGVVVVVVVVLILVVVVLLLKQLPGRRKGVEPMTAHQLSATTSRTSHKIRFRRSAPLSLRSAGLSPVSTTPPSPISPSNRRMWTHSAILCQPQWLRARFSLRLAPLSPCVRLQGWVPRAVAVVGCIGLPVSDKRANQGTKLWGKARGKQGA